MVVRRQGAEPRREAEPHHLVGDHGAHRLAEARLAAVHLGEAHLGEAHRVEDRDLLRPRDPEQTQNFEARRGETDSWSQTPL